MRAPGSTEALSAARAGEPRAIAKDFVSERVNDLGLAAGDIGEVEVSSTSYSKSSGVSHVYLQQQLAGIPVLGAILNVNIAADGRVVSLGNRFMPELELSANSPTPSVTALQAANAAVAHLELGVQPAFAARTAKPDARRHTILNDGGISAGDVPMQLIWYPRAVNDVRLAWHVHLDITETSNWWQIFVDAHTGEVLDKVDLVIHDNFGNSHGHSLKTDDHDYRASAERPRVNQAAPRADALTKGGGPMYEVFEMPAEYPYENNDPTDGGDDVPGSDPDGGRTIVTSPSDATASPFGWHDTDGSAGPEFTTTQGNNVHAYLDADANNVPDAGEPDAGASLDFTGALVALDLINDSPADYKPAAAVNLFYWNNIIHDVFYHYGFDEASGNFQENNYGNGGAGSDYVFAEAQDGSGTNNANFATPVDGSNPRMQMYIWTITTPDRDGDFSSAIIIHEYGHGISNRLTGGPSDVFCLNNAEQMGEGWSDWLGLVLTANAGDSRTTVRGVGTYALAQPPDTGGGIRPAPYTTDMGTNAFTYGDSSGLSVPHGVGFTWATIIWEVYWDLVNEHGFNPNFYGDWTTGGNNLAIQLVMDGMKLQACSPGFVDGRDAILQADVNLTGGANECLLWKAFARRGLGEAASQGSSGSNVDNSEAFDIPATCDFLGATPDTVSICAGNDAIFDITVGEAFSTPITMSVLTPPAGTTNGFTPNPVMTVPGSTELTVGSTGGLAAGTYDFNVRGDDTTTQFDLPVSMEVFDQTPGAVTLSTPTDGQQGQTVNPTLTWSASLGGGDTYNVQVATDAAFTNIVDSATDVLGSSYTVQTGLNTATTYYWRVQASNPCGTESYTAAFSFMTALAPGDCPIGMASVVTFIEDFESGAAGWTTPGGGVGTNTWATVSDRVHSGTFSYFAEDPSTISDQYLVSPFIPLPVEQSPITMRFWTNQEIEDSGSGCFDGGVLEISTDGTSWTRLGPEIVVTPYDGIVSTEFSNPIGGEDAWCGDPRDWTQTVVVVDAWAGQNVQFRFRMTSDSSVDHPGWWIDDISVQSCGFAALGSEFVINTYTLGDQLAPEIVSTGPGFVTVWHGYGAGSVDFDVQGALLDADGTKIGGDFPISLNNTDIQSHADLAATEDSGFIVVWQTNHGGDFDIVGRKFNSAGSPVGGEFMVTSSSDDQTQARIARGGGAGANFLVVWHDETSDDIISRTLSSTGSPIGSEVPVHGPATASQVAPDVAGLPSGEFIVTWQSGLDGSGTADIVATLVSSTGVPVSSDFVVNTTTSGDQTSPAVVARSTGDFAITWESGSGSDRKIMVQGFSSSGMPVGGETQVSGTGPTSLGQTDPDLDVDSNGNFTLIWRNHEMPGAHSLGQPIFITSKTSSGPPFSFQGPAINFNSDVTNALDPTLAILDPSLVNLTIPVHLALGAWEGSDGSGQGILGRTVSPQGGSPEIFDDGFESGDTTVWFSAFP